MSDESQSRPGWRVLDDLEYGSVWDRYYERFAFKASIDPWGWPSIKEPTPSITLDLSVIPDGPKRASAFWALNAEAFRCFVWALPDVKEMLVLDWQHDAWWFDRALEASTLQRDDPINGHPTVYPDGDYYSFLSPDMTEGTFGHPWERTLCIIGDRLIDSLGKFLSVWLPISRINGAPAE